MPILSFSSNDIDVITGKKTRTIRKAWKTPLKVGDRLYCYWNLVSKEKMKMVMGHLNLNLFGTCPLAMPMPVF